MSLLKNWKHNRWIINFFRIPSTLIVGVKSSSHRGKVIPGSSPNVPCGGHDELFLSSVVTSGQLLSFLYCVLLASLLPFEEGVPGLHISPGDAAIGQITDHSGQFRDLGEKGRPRISQLCICAKYLP